MLEQKILAGQYQLQLALRISGIGKHDPKVVTKSNPAGLSVNYEEVDSNLVHERTGGLYAQTVNKAIMYIGKFSTSLKYRSLYAAKKTICHQNKCKMLQTLQSDPNAEIAIYVITKQNVIAALGISSSELWEKYFDLEVAESDLIGELNPPWNTQNRTG